MKSETRLLTLSQLQSMGLVTQTPRLVHAIGWRYLPLRPDYQLGGCSFRPPGYFQEELENPDIQQVLFQTIWSEVAEFPASEFFS